MELEEWVEVGQVRQGGGEHFTYSISFFFYTMEYVFEDTLYK